MSEFPLPAARDAEADIPSTTEPLTGFEKLAPSRFCVACLHCDTTSKEPEYWKCKAPQNSHTATDQVTGLITTKPRFIYCETQRAVISGCGPSGQWFQARETAEAAQ